MNTAEHVRSLGGEVGSKFIGTDSEGTDVIEIIAIGEKSILAKCVEKNGKEFEGGECNWTLSLRDWKLVK